MLCHAATRSPTTLVVALLAIFTRATATCYRPDGSTVDDVYQPFDESAEFSACCRPAGTTYNADHSDDDNDDDENDGDARTSLGLCAGPGMQLRRGSCTDPTWTSPACLNICADGEYATADEVEITTCDDGSLCCGADNADCCARGDGVFITGDREIILPSSPAPLASPSRKRDVDSPPPSPSPAPLTPRRAPSRIIIARRALPSEAITGLAVAGAFGIVGAITVAVYVASKWKKKERKPMAAALPSGALPSYHAVSLPDAAAFGPPRGSAPLYYHTYPLWGSTYGRAELDSSSAAARPQELLGCPPAAAELAGCKYERW
ncbi:hypothetical protein F5X96DRAFT_672898 [Biscogniauxia mediterranea]|nr:hypothetical protein F5X96DRAFT_672898 [Biscogniauxia mediterranea]